MRKLLQVRERREEVCGGGVGQPSVIGGVKWGVDQTGAMVVRWGIYRSEGI